MTTSPYRHALRDARSRYADILPMPKCGIRDWRIECRRREAPAHHKARDLRMPRTRHNAESPQATRKRFFSLIEIHGEHWIWHGSMNRRDGTSLFFDSNISMTMGARRWAWSHLAHRTIGTNQQIAGNCCEPLCVRPIHAKRRWT